MKTRILVYVVAISILTTGCIATQELTTEQAQPLTPACEGDAVYVSLLSTKKHRLAGENPTVGLFIGTDSLEAWKHVGWRQGRTFASMPVGCGNTLFIAAGNGVMRSLDGGESWRITTGWEVTEVQDVAIDPHNGGMIMAATPYGMFRSTDFGDTWEDVSTGLPERFVGSVRFDRGYAHHVLAGTEGGLAVSHDAGETWDLTSVTAPVRSIRQSTANPDRWVVGLQDGGVALSSDSGISWTAATGDVLGRTIYEAEFEPSNPEVLYAAGWETGVLKSTDFGENWRQIAPEFTDRGIHAIGIRDRDGPEVLVGTMNDGLYVTRDDGETWEPVEPDIFELSQVWDIYVEGEQ